MEYRQNSPESPSIQPAKNESNLLQRGGEMSLGDNHEQVQLGQFERQSAQHIESLQQAGVVQPAVLPQPVVALPNDSQTQPQVSSVVSDVTVPLVAADVDLIEKEWVDKAKTVIAETRDDPYRREQEVKKLQIEYVKKRYGRVIGENSSLDGES